ncbi:peptidoglycan-binding protein [Streptomyces sp. NPDC051567]|uniref:peptidoglycan-binding protein n=1 Tax=Streptomyces sp. NPDC051567 TaxID=3365660 RepID=UPI0037A3588B
MQMPVFEEYEPAGDCACRGCVRRRALARGRAVPLRDGGHPAARGVRRALVLAAAAGVVLSGGPVAVATPTPVPGPVALDDPGSPQGGRAPLHGPKGGRPGAPAAVPRTDRATIVNRAKRWLEAKVPYSMSAYWRDGYRQDCSGYVSMAWNLGTNEWTGSLDTFATRITKDELLPGDMLLFHNPADPNKGSHVTLFGGWVDETRTHYLAYEQTRPSTRKQTTPYGYWENAGKYVPYRFNGVTGGIGPQHPDAEPGTEPGAEPGTEPGTEPGAGPGGEPPESGSGPVSPVAAGPGAGSALVVGAYPGDVFRPGTSHPAVTALGRRLVEKGFGAYGPAGPGPRWSEADRRSVEAFQRAQGWSGASADGYPGPETWRRLFA